MNKFSAEKGKVEISSLLGPSPVPPVPITPRLMRVVPSNIAKVVGNFEDMQG